MSLNESLITPEYARAFVGEAALTAEKGYQSLSSESSEEDETFLARFLIPAASAAIRRYTGRNFTAASYDEYFDLNQWSRYLILRNHPVASVARVTLWPHDSTAREEIDGGEFVVSRAGEIRLKPTSTASSLFPPGFQSVRVEYSAGEGVPDDVQWACGRLVSALLSAMGREPGVVAEANNGYSKSFSSAALTTIAANPELRAILDPLRNGRVVSSSGEWW